MSGGCSDVISRSLLCCALCKEDFTEPKILPCLHSFCKNCLKKHITTTTTDPNNITHCPECETEFDLGDEGVRSLSDNHFLKRLLSPQSKDEEKEQKCQRCRLSSISETKEASYRCLNCEELLCENCHEIHNQESETMSHHVEEFSKDFNNAPSEKAKLTSELIKKCCMKCDTYDTASMFCVTCDIMTCPECQVNVHDKHRSAELHAVAVNFENKVDEPLADIEDNANELSKNIACLSQTKEAITDRKKFLKEFVKQRKDYLQEMVENYAKTVTIEIDRQFEQNLSEIDQQKNRMEMQVSSINAVLNFTDMLLAYGNDEEKVVLRKQIGGRIRHLSDNEIEEGLIELYCVDFKTQKVSVETICDLFGELTQGEITNLEHQDRQTHKHVCTNQSSIDSGHFSESNGEFGDLGESFNGRQRKKSVQFDNNVMQSSYVAEHIFCLDHPVTEFPIPAGIQRDCIKGMGINSNGDIIIGAVFSEGQCIYIVEKHGIIRGKIPVDKGWNLHSVASDGKVAMIINRGENRYKVRVLKDDCSETLVEESNIHTYGLHFVTANSRRQVIVTSNRFSKVCGTRGKSVKSGGNIAIHDRTGHLTHRITNENFQDINLYVLEKPTSVVVGSNNNIYIVDSGSHLVAGFSRTGELLFTFGNSDTDDTEVYEGPDGVALDGRGNLIVTDKRSNRIDILTEKGCLRKTFYIEHQPKFVAAAKNKQIMVTSPEGSIKFYEYD